ncbi:MAG: hypothetical protein K2Q21_00690 [Chitinophagaceae bacterium]|nr:hypothetical protein [Chitinophagaceae bacterium]
MDLDQFKNELNTKLATDHTHRSDADFEYLLKQKTNSFIDKIKRSLWFEIIFGFIINFGFVYAAFCAGLHSFRIYFGVFSILMYLFLFFLIYLLLKTNKIRNADLPVKSNLESYIRLLDEFIKRYLQLTMALIPICIIFSGTLGYMDNHTNQALAAAHASPKMSETVQIILAVALLIIVALGMYGMYYFTKWYLKKLYGNFLTDLKACVADLQDT